MARPSFLVKRPRRRGLDRYLLDGERIVTASHRHWAKIALPVSSVVVGLVVALAVDTSVPDSLSAVATLLWWAWFVLVGWALWKVLEWRHDWFVATDKRLVLTYGLVTQQVGMMPLAKVTDMSYNRSPAGRLLGYGTFVMESAGQDQALHRVRWVARPDQTYRAICAEIFEVDDQERVLDADVLDNRLGDGPPSKAPGPYTDYSPAPDGPDRTNHSQGIRIRPADSGRDGNDRHDPWHQDPTRSGDDVHDADTGPIPYWRPSTDENDR